jgi:hypothetical protein
MQRSLILRLFVLCVALTLTAACGGPGEPVGEMTVSSDAVTLTYPESTSLDLRFEPASSLEGAVEPRLFVHLLDPDGELVRTFDRVLPFEWRPGQPVEHRVELWQSALVAPLPAGEYSLTAGLYDAAGRRWPLVTTGEEIDDQEYRVATVTVPAAGSAVQVSFPGTWRALEKAGDKQVMARRWLEDGGGIAFGGLSGPLDVSLDVVVPTTQRMEGQRQVLDDGAAAPRVELTSDCAASRTLDEVGDHRIELTLVPPAGATECTVTFDPNYVYLDLESFEKRSVSLERVTYRASASSPSAPPSETSPSEGDAAGEAQSAADAESAAVREPSEELPRRHLPA